MQYQMKCGTVTGVADSLGGELVAFRRDGVAYGWEGDEAHWGGKAPVLFPVIGFLKNNRVVLGGKEVEIEKHGFARHSSFGVETRSEQAITFVLRESQETLNQYPFPFVLRITHMLLEDGYETIYRVENTGEQPMPFCLGGHPAFCCPVNGQGAFADYQLEFAFPEEKRPLEVGATGILTGRRVAGGLPDENGVLPLEYNLFDNDALVYDGLRSRQVRLVHKQSGKGIAFTFQGFGVLGVWTPTKKEAPFLCLEPWAGLPAFEDETGRFEDKPFSVLLQPGKEYTASYLVRILD